MTIDVRFTSGARGTVLGESVEAVRKALIEGTDVVARNGHVAHLRAALTVDLTEQAGHPCVLVAIESSAPPARMKQETREAVRRAAAEFRAHLRAAARTGTDVRGRMIPGARFVSRHPYVGAKTGATRRTVHSGLSAEALAVAGTACECRLPLPIGTGRRG